MLDGVIHVGKSTDNHVEVLMQILKHELRLTDAELDRMMERLQQDWDDYFEGRVLVWGYRTTTGRFVTRGEAWLMLTPRMRKEIDDAVGAASTEMSTDVLAQLYEEEPVLKVKRVRDDAMPAFYRGREGD